MKTLITICARGGSKSIPGKNIKLLNGKPLIAYSIEIAQKFAQLHPSIISLSTDDVKIKQVAQKYGLKTSYDRPATLATDKAGKIGSIEDLKNYEEKKRDVQFDLIIDLDITSPLRTIEDLQSAIQLLQANKKAHNIFSVSPASRNPYFNMVEAQPDGYVKLVKTGNTILSRQEAPAVYDMNASFYIFRPSFFTEGYNSSVTDHSLAYVVPHICFDLDYPHDFIIMELMIKHKLLDFQL